VEAFTAEEAKTMEELGLQISSSWLKIGLRDYQPIAFKALVEHEIINILEDGRYYLPRERYDRYITQKGGA
ncbi:MAG: hypothetical protein J7L90_01170, partial [Dehalococcoidia bacterium]|nr:hypothetical protein [Dehalococcoidia bacterium]